MKSFTEYIGYQFGNPQGLVGQICCQIMNRMNSKMYSSLVSALELDEQSSLLEVGYGNGYLIEKIYKKSQPTIYGIDISSDAKKLALKRNRNIEKSKLFLDIGDCCDLKYENGKFDAVVTINTIYFWEDIEKGLSEIHRTLKESGVFYNVVYAKDWLQKLPYTKKGFKLFEAEELMEMGKKVGFKDFELVELSKAKSYIMVCKK